MKLLLFILSLSIFANPRILMIDTGLKNDIKRTDDFTIDEYLKRRFPIYADDKKAIAEGILKMAKSIDKSIVVNESVGANHTTIHLKVDPEKMNAVSVRLVTKIEGEQTFFDFNIIQNETDRRMAQRKLIDLLTYLGE